MRGRAVQKIQQIYLKISSVKGRDLIRIYRKQGGEMNEIWKSQGPACDSRGGRIRLGVVQ